MKKYKDVLLYSFLILIGFIFVISKIKPEISSILTIENDIKTKTAEVTDLQQKLDAFKKSEIDAQAEKNMPSTQVKNIYRPETTSTEAESSFTVIFDDIIDMAKYNGIKVYSIEYNYNPPEDDFVKNAGSQYNVCLLNMQLVSDYSDLESFLKELYKYPYLLNITKLEITPYTKNKKIIVSSVQIKLYASK